MVEKSLEEINALAKSGQAVVVTAEEVVELVRQQGIKQTARQVDVVTTATFAPMCSSGAFLNFGHPDPPMRMTEVSLNSVPAYAGVAAVDAYIGATELANGGNRSYGGAHVICDLVNGKPVRLQAKSYATDCYPRTEVTTTVSLGTLNQAYLFNPRNAYQNYAAATNSSGQTIHTYMGTLLPHLGSVTYCSAGELSPLLNDPYYRTIGVGTRVFLGGGEGFVAWEGTQHNPSQARTAGGVPIGNAGALALIGNLRGMNGRYLRPAVFAGYGVTLFVGVGIPIPVLDEEMMEFLSISNDRIFTKVYDYSVPRRERPALGRVSYQQLRSGQVDLAGKRIKTSPLSSLAMAREIAQLLKRWVAAGSFPLERPVRPLSLQTRVHTLQADAGEVN
jgi:uncharacterized protein (DUF39 family)